MTVGIDIGTTSVKAVAVTESGLVVASCRIPHLVNVPSVGRLEHDAEVAWRQGPRRALAALEATAPVALAVSAMAPSMTAVDAEGAPVGPGLLYGDERGRVGEGSGSADPTSSPEALGLLRWSATHRPGAAGYWPAQAVANRALGAPAVVDLGTAFTTGPLLGTEGWNEELCASCGVDATQMPEMR
ncbi:MAG: FGGY family carbohydrate kinase, partial [Actinomycetota bacterium]|nr:FGGY family carbohydrate kinase [Actinomycetota bacterium]